MVMASPLLDELSRRVFTAVADLELPRAVFKTCPWQPRELIETGLRMHHHPDGGAPSDVRGASDPVGEQLRRTVIAWSLVATPGEECVLWDLDQRVGVDHPWGLGAARVAAIAAAVTELNAAGRSR
jgi:hypothetical protein